MDRGALCVMLNGYNKLTLDRAFQNNEHETVGEKNTIILGENRTLFYHFWAKRGKSIWAKEVPPIFVYFDRSPVYICIYYKYIIFD